MWLISSFERGVGVVFCLFFLAAAGEGEGGVDEGVDEGEGDGMGWGGV